MYKTWSEIYLIKLKFKLNLLFIIYIYIYTCIRIYYLIFFDFWIKAITLKRKFDSDV